MGSRIPIDPSVQPATGFTSNSSLPFPKSACLEAHPRARSHSPVHHATEAPKFFLPEDFQCPVCFETKRDIAKWGFVDCGHVLCVDCLEDHYIKHAGFESHEHIRKTCPTCRGEFHFFHHMRDLPPEQQALIYEQMSGKKEEPPLPTSRGGGAAPPLETPVMTPPAAPRNPAPPPSTADMLRFICATAVALVERPLGPSPHPVARCARCKLISFSYANPGYNCTTCSRRICRDCSVGVPPDNPNARLCRVHLYHDDNPAHAGS